jgi:RND superfamily putative drug exporter
MKPNLAQRAGRWSAAHWKTATFGWIALVAVAAALGMLIGTNKLTEAQQGTGETATAQRILDRAGFQRPAGESVLIQSKSLSASDPRFRATVASVTQELAARHEVGNVRSPYQAGAVSQDGHSALVAFDMVGEADKAKEHVQPVLDAVAAAQRDHPGFTITPFGPASAQHALDSTIGKDFQRAEQLSYRSSS